MTPLRVAHGGAMPEPRTKQCLTIDAKAARASTQRTSHAVSVKELVRAAQALASSAEHTDPTGC